MDTKKVRSCIECYSCLSVCPVIKETKEFAGPYFMRYISKFDFDPRDIGERTKEVLMKDYTIVLVVVNVEKYVQKKLIVLETL